MYAIRFYSVFGARRAGPNKVAGEHKHTNTEGSGFAPVSGHLLTEVYLVFTDEDTGSVLGEKINN